MRNLKMILRFSAFFTNVFVINTFYVLNTGGRYRGPCDGVFRNECSKDPNAKCVIDRCSCKTGANPVGDICILGLWW